MAQQQEPSPKKEAQLQRLGIKSWQEKTHGNGSKSYQPIQQLHDPAPAHQAILERLDTLRQQVDSRKQENEKELDNWRQKIKDDPEYIETIKKKKFFSECQEWIQKELLDVEIAKTDEKKQLEEEQAEARRRRNSGPMPVEPKGKSGNPDDAPPKAPSLPEEPLTDEQRKILAELTDLRKQLEAVKSAIKTSEKREAEKEQMKKDGKTMSGEFVRPTSTTAGHLVEKKPKLAQKRVAAEVLAALAQQQSQGAAPPAAAAAAAAPPSSAAASSH